MCRHVVRRGGIRWSSRISPAGLQESTANFHLIPPLLHVVYLDLRWLEVWIHTLTLFFNLKKNKIVMASKKIIKIMLALHRREEVSIVQIKEYFWHQCPQLTLCVRHPVLARTAMCHYVNWPGAVTGRKKKRMLRLFRYPVTGRDCHQWMAVNRRGGIRWKDAVRFWSCTGDLIDDHLIPTPSD